MKLRKHRRNAAILHTGCCQMTSMNTPQDDPQFEEWLRLTRRVREDSSVPFDEQWEIFRQLAAKRPNELGPMPAWWPNLDRIADSNIGRLTDELGLRDYEELHRWSVDHREAFWRRSSSGCPSASTASPKASSMQPAVRRHRGGCPEPG